MGGGDTPDVPDAPDYTELVDLMKASAGYSFNLSKEMQDFFKEAYTDNKGVSDIVINKMLGQMDRQEEYALADRARYDNVFKPLQDRFIADAESYASPERQEYEAGKAEADVATQFEAARDAASQRLEAYGVDPSQTRQGSLDLGSRVAEAAAQASAGNQARDNTVNKGLALRSAAINMGAPLPAQAMSEAGQAGNFGNASVNTGLATTASGAQTLGTGPQWEGGGQGAVGTWGNIINQGFSNEMDRYNAQVAAQQGQSSGIGTALGLATSFLPFFAEGGAIPEDEGAYLDPAMSPSGGAIPDDIDAELESGTPAKLNAGEFILPKDVVSWMGEKGIQQLILKARKEMTGGEGERPAQPSNAPPPMSVEGQGAIPMPPGA